MKAMRKAAGLTAVVMCVGVSVASAQDSQEQQYPVSPEMAAAAPCGFSKTGDEIHSNGTHTVYFTVRNCHAFAVNRRAVVSNGPDGSCSYFAPGATHYSSLLLSFNSDVEGIKPC